VASEWGSLHRSLSYGGHAKGESEERGGTISGGKNFTPQMTNKSHKPIFKFQIGGVWERRVWLGGPVSGNWHLDIGIYLEIGNWVFFW
jgi:hypothetical protein